MEALKIFDNLFFIKEWIKEVYAYNTLLAEANDHQQIEYLKMKLSRAIRGIGREYGELHCNTSDLLLKCNCHNCLNELSSEEEINDDTSTIIDASFGEHSLGPITQNNALKRKRQEPDDNEHGTAIPRQLFFVFKDNENAVAHIHKKCKK
jgi:hypothetical protein